MTPSEKKMVQKLADASEALVLAVLREVIRRGTSPTMNYNGAVIAAIEELVAAKKITRPTGA